jgi:hypothetical protein
MAAMILYIKTPEAHLDPRAKLGISKSDSGYTDEGVEQGQSLALAWPTIVICSVQNSNDIYQTAMPLIS